MFASGINKGFDYTRSAPIIIGLVFAHSTLTCCFANAESEPDQSDYIITGHVKDLDGRPIVGATVEWGSDKEPFSRRQRTLTDATGAYRLVFNKSVRENHFAVSAPGFATELRQTRFERGQQIRDFILRRPENECTIAGTVVDQKGAPIPGARVAAFTPRQGTYSSFSSPHGGDYFPGPDHVATSDAEGRFRIDGLPEGQVQLRVQAKHRYVGDNNYPVKEGARIVMSGSGKPGIVQGRLLDASTNKPPQKVREIRIVSRYTTANQSCSDDNGYFHLPGEPTLGEVCYVYVYADGYAAIEAKIHVAPLGSDDFKTIELTPAPSVRGQLIDAATGQPIKNANLLYGVADGRSYIEWSGLEKYADGYHSLKFVQHVVSKDRGEFWFAEPPDKQGMIIGLIPGYQRLLLKAGDRTTDKDTGRLTVRLNRESAFTGIVLQNGKPLPNASISISSKQPEDPTQFPETVKADADGKYRYGCLHPGKHYIHGGPYTRVAEVGAGETKTVNLGENLGPIRIHGKATPESTIQAIPTFEWEYTCVTTEASEEGEYELRGLKPGAYRLIIQHPRTNGEFAPGHDTRLVQIKDDDEIDLNPRQINARPRLGVIPLNDE